MEYDELNASGEVVRMRFKPTGGYIVPAGHSLVPYTMPFSVKKLIKKEEIEQYRNQACYSPVTVSGYQWQADKRSQELISTAINLALAGVAPVPMTWRTLSNEDIPATLDLLKDIAGTIALQTKNSYEKSWLLKAQIETAITDQDLEAIVWD